MAWHVSVNKAFQWEVRQQVRFFLVYIWSELGLQSLQVDQHWSQSTVSLFGVPSLEVRTLWSILHPLSRCTKGFDSHLMSGRSKDGFPWSIQTWGPTWPSKEKCTQKHWLRTSASINKKTCSAQWLPQYRYGLWQTVPGQTLLIYLSLIRDSSTSVQRSSLV